MKIPEVIKDYCLYYQIIPIIHLHQDDIKPVLLGYLVILNATSGVDPLNLPNSTGFDRRKSLNRITEFHMVHQAAYLPTKLWTRVEFQE